MLQLYEGGSCEWAPFFAGETRETPELGACGGNVVEELLVLPVGEPALVHHATVLDGWRCFEPRSARPWSV
jgi:hypothetical protein